MRPTVNKMGYMCDEIDPYTQKFIDYAASIKKPVLDVGAGDGIASVAVLQRGGSVVANDLAVEHLNQIVKNTPEAFRQNLQIIPGAFPEVVDFEADYFGAVIVSRVFHFFDGVQIETALDKLFKMMCSGARIYIIADTVYMKHLLPLHEIYEENVKVGLKWPGLFNDFKSRAETQSAQNSPGMMHFLDVPVMVRSVEKAGFVVDEASLFSRTDYPPTIRFDGREGVGIVAIKP